MKARKPLMVAGIIGAISVAGIGVATASTHPSHFVAKVNGHFLSTSTSHFASSAMPMIGQVDPITTVLADLVKAGTITQAQSDAISAALTTATPPRPSISGITGAGDDDSDGPDLNGSDAQGDMTNQGVQGNPPSISNTDDQGDQSDNTQVGAPSVGSDSQGND